jgi:hypothetical protein
MDLKIGAKTMATQTRLTSGRIAWIAKDLTHRIEDMGMEYPDAQEGIIKDYDLNENQWVKIQAVYDGEIDA